MFAAEIRRKRVGQLRSSRRRWHLDEVFVRINGVQHYLWRVLSEETSVVTSTCARLACLLSLALVWTQGTLILCPSRSGAG